MAQKTKKARSGKSAASASKTRKAAKVKALARVPSPEKIWALPANSTKLVSEINQFLLNGAPNEAMETFMTQGKSKFDKMTKDGANMGRESTEAIMKASAILAKGFEDYFQTSISLAQSSAEKQAKYLKEAMSSKTLNEWTEVQNKMAQANFDDFMAGITKLSELGVKLMSQSMEPLNEQMTKGMKKTGSYAA